MICFDTFGRTVLFGAAAAVCWLPWLILAAPILGPPTALAWYLIATTAIYIGGLSSVGAHRLALALVAMVIGAVFAGIVGTTSNLILILAVSLGLARSGFVYAAPTAHAVIKEAVLLGGGFLFAWFVAGSGAMPTGAALWAFFLVQALFFLVPRPRSLAAAGNVDSFDAAYRRALILLDEHRI